MSMSEQLELVSATKSFGGWVKRYKHYSRALDCDMIFAIYLPPQAEEGRVPLMWWLSGLTCNDENFMQKAGAQRMAAELGIAIVCPDTSPRGLDLPGEHDSYDFGSGAGFYLNAKREPWSKHYRMYDYVTEELPSVVRLHFPVNGRESISGHSIGGAFRRAMTWSMSACARSTIPASSLPRGRRVSRCSSIRARRITSSRSSSSPSGWRRSARSMTIR